jgi:hypothetical protein
MPEAEDRKIRLALTSPGLDYNSVRPFKVTEVRTSIHNLRSTKSPGYDLITGNLLKELPEVGMRAITQIFNSILRTRHFPGLWNVSQIISILKPGKLPEEVQSYRPICLLPVLSKVFEKIFITRMLPTLKERQAVPDHQFGFRKKTSHH